MGKAIKSVAFVFENCETLILNYPDIFMFQIWGEKVSFHSYINCISIDNSVAGFYAGISKDAKPTDGSCHWETDREEQSISRLEKYQDIAQIAVNFDDSSQHIYLVQWPEGDEMNHSGQTLTRTEEGHILYTSLLDGDTKNIPSLEEVDVMAYTVFKKETK